MASMIMQMHTHTRTLQSHTHSAWQLAQALRLCTWLLVCPVQVRRAVYSPMPVDSKPTFGGFGRVLYITVFLYQP